MCRTILGELLSFAIICGGQHAKRANCDAGVVASRTSSKTTRILFCIGFSRRLQLVLAMAVNVDFDYFSRHSEAGWVSPFFYCNLGPSLTCDQTRIGHLALWMEFVRLKNTISPVVRAIDKCGRFCVQIGTCECVRIRCMRHCCSSGLATRHEHKIVLSSSSLVLLEFLFSSLRLQPVILSNQPSGVHLAPSFSYGCLPTHNLAGQLLNRITPGQAAIGTTCYVVLCTLNYNPYNLYCFRN